MLVVTRKERETIWIEDVKITITHIGRGKVKIGIDAHKDINIVRGELKDKENVVCWKSQTDTTEK